MSLDILPSAFGIVPETHPYNTQLSSSASSSTSSVFSDAASQVSSVSSTSSQSSWESDEWRSRVSAVDSMVPVESASLPSFTQVISRSNTYPQFQPVACQAVESLPSLRSEFLAPTQQRSHPRRSSTALQQRAPPQLVRQSHRKVNFVDCLVG